jgi:hypothetical protein
MSSGMIFFFVAAGLQPALNNGVVGISMDKKPYVMRRLKTCAYHTGNNAIHN